MFDLDAATAARLGSHSDYPACCWRDLEATVRAIVGVCQPAPEFFRIFLAPQDPLANLS